MTRKVFRWGFAPLAVTFLIVLPPARLAPGSAERRHGHDRQRRHRRRRLRRQRAGGRRLGHRGNNATCRPK